MDGSSPAAPAGLPAASKGTSEPPAPGPQEAQPHPVAAGAEAKPHSHADGAEHGGEQLSPAEVRTYIGQKVRPLDGEQDGLYAVALPDGEQLVTHGPDLHLAGEPPPSGDQQRPPICAGQNAQHVLYGRPAGSPDRSAEVLAEIRTEIARENAVLNSASLASGGPVADYRVLCEGSGQLRVDSFVNPSDASFSSVVGAARAAGFDRGDLNYTIFYDGSNGCGIGSIYSDDRLAADNWNNRGGGYGIAYAGCWRGVPMHENAHNMGAVQYGAPNSTGSGAHCLDDSDVMCYSDGGDRDTGTFIRCPGVEQFDCGHDDYFDSAPEPGEYLSSHWNIGSRMNRFLTFARELAPPGSLEAERAGLDGGVQIGGEHDGYSGEGYVEWIGDPSAQARFAVSSAGASPATLDLHYANGSGAPGAVWVLVNGTEVAQAQLAPLASWNVWGNATVPISLAAGANTVAVRQGAGAGIALDYVTLHRGDPDPSTQVLTPGTTISGRTGRRTSVRMYKVEVPVGQGSLQVSLDGPGRGAAGKARSKKAVAKAKAKAKRAGAAKRPVTNLDLQLRPGAALSASSSVCRPLRGSSDETCTVANPAPGWWFVGVELRQGKSKQPFRLTASLG